MDLINETGRPRSESTAEHPPDVIDRGLDPAARQADVIEANSPEGRPGDPTLRAPGMAKWFLLMILGVVAVAIFLAITQGIIAGLFALVFGLCLGIVANSEFWATASRAKERYNLDRHVDQGASHKF